MLVVDGVEMLDVREAARLAGRTPETVRRWVWSGRLSAIRQGNRLLLARGDVAVIAGGGTPAARAGRIPAAEALSLAGWVRLADERRRDGSLPPGVAGGSAADLVAADRRSRDEG